MFGKMNIQSMKYTFTALCCFFLLIGLQASAQDDILLPENFYVHKGDKLTLHLISANQFVKQDELGFDPSKFESFALYAGSRKDARPIATKAGDSVATVQIEKEGLNLIAMKRKQVIDDVERDDFLKILDDEGLSTFSEKAKNGSKDNFRERYTWYLKTLVKADKNSPNDFEKSVDQEYEIILKDNPYKGNYGDDIIGQVLFRGRPAVTAEVLFYIKTPEGNTFVQKLSSDKQGLIYFKLTREGIYMLRSLHMEESKDKKADYDTWLTTYTFAFTSVNTMPNTYKEFGFGNKH
jgi:uncharacterized GH25 family protein